MRWERPWWRKGAESTGLWGGEWEKPLGTTVVIGKGEGQGERAMGMGGEGPQGVGGGKGGILEWGAMGKTPGCW